MQQNEALPSKKHLPFGGAKSINDKTVLDFLNEIKFNNIFENILTNDITKLFLQNYFTWIQKSEKNKFIGLDSFNYKVFSNGTTESFDKWYIRHRNRRLRIFKGEYMYHYACFRNLNYNFAWLDNEPLDENDHIIISFPFADSGGLHQKMNEILDNAYKLKIPVLIDAAYLGTTNNLSFDFSHKAIDTVVTSLSKTFPVSYSRIGMRLCRNDIDDGLDIYRKTFYDNRFGAFIGNELISNFDIDYIPNNYFEKQKKVCQSMNLELSNSVLFGLGNSDYDEYSRAGIFNRLFLGNFYEKFGMETRKN